MSDQKELTADEETSLGADLAAAEVVDDALISAADLPDDTPKKGRKRKLKPAEPQQEEPEPAAEPEMSSPEWSEFVMTQFTEDEKDPDGRPKVNGLRRVVRKLLGPILKSAARVVQGPNYGPGDRYTMLTPAVVEHTVVVLMSKLDGELSRAYEAEFTEAADCYYGNMPNEQIAAHLTATASTRAESRALRKALLLDTISAEERSVVPSVEASVGGMIALNQINFINVLCHRLDVDVMKYVNMGKQKFRSIEEVPFGVAQKMVEHLSNLQNNRDAIPDTIKGYDPDWRKS